MTGVRLARRIEAMLAIARADLDSVRVLRRIVDAATATFRFVDHRDLTEFSYGVGDAVDAVEALVRGGKLPVDAVDLALHAIERVESACLSADDSWDEIGSEPLRAQPIHLEACRRAKPPPRELARTLFAKELESQLGAFDRAAWTYRDVLGTDGLDECRRLLEAEREVLAAASRSRGGSSSIDVRRLDEIEKALNGALGGA